MPVQLTQLHHYSKWYFKDFRKDAGEVLSIKSCASPFHNWLPLNWNFICYYIRKKLRKMYISVVQWRSLYLQHSAVERWEVYRHCSRYCDVQQS